MTDRARSLLTALARRHYGRAVVTKGLLPIARELDELGYIGQVARFGCGHYVAVTDAGRKALAGDEPK